MTRTVTETEVTYTVNGTETFTTVYIGSGWTSSKILKDLEKRNPESTITQVAMKVARNTYSMAEEEFIKLSTKIN